MKNTTIAIILFLTMCWNVANCQQQDTIPQEQPAVFQIDTIPIGIELPDFDTVTTPTPADTDTLLAKKRRFLYRLFKEDYPNPNKALYLSLAVPGGGQIYNRRWWKLPFVWGGYVGLIYAVDYNTKNYKLLRDAYIAELEGREHPFTGTRLRANDLRRLRDQFDKDRQLSYIGIVGLHIVQAADAFVDCHLKTFDVSDDLSLRLKPSLIADPLTGPTLGLGFALTVR